MDEPPDISALRVAVIGLGSIGNRHLNNLAELGVTRRVVVRRSEKTNAAFAPPESVTVVHSAEDAIGQGLDAAIVCTPSAMHLESAAPFLEAGVPVIMEKPLEASLAAARELVRLADDNNVYAAVAYCMRHHPAYRAAAEYIRAGKLGTIRSARAVFHTYLPDWHPYEDYRQSYAARAELGGGVIPTLDHEIDFLLWTLGPAEVTAAELADGRESLGIDVPAAAKITLAHQGGATSCVDLSFAAKEFRREFEFQGAEGTLKFDFADGKLTLVRRDLAEPNRIENLAIATVGGEDIAAMYATMLRAFLVEITEPGTPSTPLSSGVSALAVCERACKAAGY